MKIDIAIKTPTGWINIYNDYDEDLSQAAIADVVEENNAAIVVGTHTETLTDLELHVIDAFQTVINRLYETGQIRLSEALMESERQANFD